MNVVLENGEVPNAATLNVRLGDIPSEITFASDPTLTAADISHLAGLVDLVGFGSTTPAATGNVSPLSATRFNLTYDVTNADSYAGSISTFDDYGTAPIESVDLSGLTDFILGLRLQSGTGSIKIVFEDATGAQSVAYLSGVDGTERFYQVVMNQLDPIDWTQICNVTLMVENTRVSQNVGTLEVRFGDNYYIPFLTGSAYDSSVLTDLSAVSPLTNAGSGNTVLGDPNAIMNFTQSSTSEFEYDYDLTPDDTAFTFVELAGGTSMNLSTQQYIFAAQGSSGERVKVTLVDADGLAATFIIQLEAYMQNFVLNLSGGSAPVGFDYTRVATITFVEDQTIGTPLLNDYVKIETKGLEYTPVVPNADFEATRIALVQAGLDYFVPGVGIDPATHFPYDNLGDGAANPGYYTQPTLIGFYAQILGDVVNGNIDNGMTTAQALAELNTVMTNLLIAQSNYGWNGLLPWLDLNPLAASSNTIGLGDNANLSQSLAVMVGALESAGLSGADLTAAQQIATQVEQFLNAQATGYATFVDPTWGVFRAAYDISSGTYDSYLDRVANEFRGAIAFVATYYASVPSSVWDNLTIAINDNYVDRNTGAIDNLAPWDGGAFQIFWPGLRNDESTYIGFRDALYNMLVTQLDYAYQNRIPGILSASMTPEGGYLGDVGIPQIAELNMVPASTNILTGDIGSTYALASAMGIDSNAVLGWLNAIDNLSGMMGDYGFYDAARSGSELVNRFVGIDVASMILGLSGSGASDFTTYLRNRGIEDEYNGLYDAKSRQMLIDRTTTTFPDAPEFPDRSFAIFSNFSSEGTINNFNGATTQVYGVTLSYNNLAGVDSGHFWIFDQAYDAQANQLILVYSAPDSPQTARIELKDAVGTVLYQTNINLQEGAEYTRLVIDLPNWTSLAAVQELDLVVDPDEGGDATGNFTVHSIDFQHVPSSQTIDPDGTLGAGDVTTLPNGGVAEVASSPVATISEPFANVYQISFDLNTGGSYSELLANFDPLNNGSSVDLSGFSSLVFGISSAQATTIKFEIEDASGQRATYYAQNVDVSGNYYEFLTSLAAGSVDLSHVTALHFTADESSVSSGNEVGDFQVEIGGLQYP